jgi:hypothetical protein
VGNAPDEAVEPPLFAEPPWRVSAGLEELSVPHAAMPDKVVKETASIAKFSRVIVDR